MQVTLKLYNFLKIQLFSVSKVVRFIAIKTLQIAFSWSIVRIKNKGDFFQYEDKDGRTIFFSQKTRVARYRYGVQNKLECLQKEYCTNDIVLPKDSIVVDIGSNIGEFGQFWKDKGYDVHAFEPDIKEFRVMSINLKGETTYNFGLWNETTKLKFFSANETGDSSLIQFDLNQNDAVEIEVKRLDEIDFHGRKIGLIKLEAEGAEPEIIDGGNETFKRALYVSCDVGPERGSKKENTLIPVLEKLSHLGFKPIKFNHKRYSLLFINTRSI